MRLVDRLIDRIADRVVAKIRDDRALRMSARNLRIIVDMDRVKAAAQGKPSH